MMDEWRKSLASLPLEELEKAKLFIDLLIVKLKEGDTRIEQELGLKGTDEPLGAEEESRNHRRHKVFYPCQYQVMGTSRQELLSGAILDISQGGCQMKLDHPLRVGEMLRIRMDVSDRGVRQVVGKIRWIRMDPQGEMDSWFAGIEFVFDRAKSEA